MCSTRSKNITVNIFGKPYSIPVGLTILRAMEYVGYTPTYDADVLIIGGGGAGAAAATAAIITHPQYCYILDHTFDGRNTAADGSGTSYLQGAVIENINSNITLYAQFTYVVDETVGQEG